MPSKKSAKSSSTKKSSVRFEAVKIDPLFTALDAVAWLDSPTTAQIAEFAAIDVRTAGKLLKNARLIGLITSPDDQSYILAQAYPFKGSLDEKRKVVRESLLRLKLIRDIRQFMSLGDELQTAMRKAAVVGGTDTYDKAAIAPLVTWANAVGSVFDLAIEVETLIDQAVVTKEVRRNSDADDRVAFISHSSKDKGFVRRLAADLVRNGIKVWLDEQQILIGDSISERVAQGLADSDFFLLVVSENSVASPWVHKELSTALIHEIERRKVTVLPMRLDDADLPLSVKDKLYADFRASYETGLNKVVSSIRARKVTRNA